MIETDNTNKKVGLFTNLLKDTELLVTKKIAAFLFQNHCQVLLQEEVASCMGKRELGVPEESLFQLPDFLIVLGGDGTILQAGREAAQYDTPILGINMGRLGYLSAVEKAGYEEAICNVLNGQYQVESRMMLESRIYNNKQMGALNYALNDICITRGMVSKIVDLHVYANYEYLDTFRGDGIIIATPTGSTAYNLSAGGPILKPDTQIMVITPICPHSLYSRSIVISAEDSVTIEVGNKSRGDLIFSNDGQDGIPLSHDDVIRIKKSNRSTKIMKTNQIGFYDRLRRKLADQ